ncbi:unnamed protein product, partial [Brassica oleracea]
AGPVVWPRVSLTSPNKVVGAWRWRSSALYPLGVLGGVSQEEVFRASPTALYESWVQRVYTVTGCWWRLSSPEDVGAVCFKVWGAFLSVSSRRLEALSVIDSLLDPSR